MVIIDGFDTKVNRMRESEKKLTCVKRESGVDSSEALLRVYNVYSRHVK